MAFELTDFYISNFRELRNVRINASSNLNVLIGRNGSGKTSILSALESLGTRRDAVLSATESLSVWKPEFGDGWLNRDLGVYSIFKLDDDLNGDLTGSHSKDPMHLNENEDPEYLSIRSVDSLNLLLAAVGGESSANFFHTERSINERTEVWKSGNAEVISNELLYEKVEDELKRASELFRCIDSYEALRRSLTEPSLSFNFSGSPLRDDDVWRRLFENEIREPETLEKVEIFDRAASQMIPLILSCNHLAWTGSGYAGIAINRDDIPPETGELLTKVNSFSREDSGSRIRFHRPLSAETIGESIDYKIISEHLADTTAYSQYSSQPGFAGYRFNCTHPLFDIAEQWVNGSNFVLARLTAYPRGESIFASPDKTVLFSGMPQLSFSQRYGEWDESWSEQESEDYEQFLHSNSYYLGMAADNYEALFGERLPHPMTLREKETKEVGSFPSFFPPSVWMVGADSDSVDLNEVFEEYFYAFHKSIWEEITYFAFLNIQSNLFREEYKDLVRKIFEIPLDSKGSFLFSPDGRTWKIDPRVKTTLKLLETWVNHFAPPLIGFAGSISFEILPVNEWSENRFFEIRFADKPLEQVPSGLSRWISISLRMALRKLNNSTSYYTLKHWLLTDEELEIALLEYAMLPESIPLEELTYSKYINRFFSEDSHNPQGDVIFDGEVVFRGQGGRYLFREALAFLVLINEPDREDLIKRFRSPYVEDEQTLLIDEPENHLHPNAMVDIRNWLTETISDPSISAILATHSPTFLDYSHEEASIVLVEKPPAQTAIAEDITNDVVYWLSEYGGSLGGETIDRLMLMRGFLLVEGPHDEEVINHFYEDELKRRRLGVLPMWGFKGLKLLDTRYLCYSDRPIVMLFDNIPVDHSREQQSMEETQLKRIKRELREATFPFWSTGHKELDIIFTLPEKVVKRYLESKGINDTFNGGWKQIQQEIRSDSAAMKSGVGKKTKAGQLLGLPNPEDLNYFPNFIAPVLQMCSENDRPTATLEDTMSKIFAFFDNPHSNR